MEPDPQTRLSRYLRWCLQTVASRYGFEAEALDGGFTSLSLEAVLEVLPLPHQRFVQEHLDYYRRRLRVIEKEGARGALVAWSLEEPMVRVVGVSETELSRARQLPWTEEPKPLREGFQEMPRPLTLSEARRLAVHILQVEGVTPQEEPLFLPPNPEHIIEAVIPRMRTFIPERGVEGSARLLVEITLHQWAAEGEEPQAIAVTDVGRPLPSLMAFDDPRPLLWKEALA